MNFLLRMLLPQKVAKDSETEDLSRYRRIWWRTVILTLLVTLVPLFVMLGVNYYLFQRALRSDIRHRISQDVSNISRSLEVVLEERVAALRFLSRQEVLSEFGPQQLADAFENLRIAFGDFIDLGLIGLEGRQLLYSGPYNLQGDDYQEEDWFHEALLRGIYVSDVFLGHREFPHFVVVVRHGDFLLRATVDMELLNRQVFISGTGPLDDVFLVNNKGVLQTKSRFHGSILKECNLPVPAYSPKDEIVENVSAAGVPYFLGYRHLRKTPFVLMVVRTPARMLTEWSRSSAELITFVLISVVLIGIVVLWSSTTTIKQIRAADLDRAQMFKNIEYTSKMATIGRLAASVAHEINNPLAIINEKAGLLMDLIGSSADYPLKEKFLRNLDSITKSVERCRDVTHRLLGFTRRVKVNWEWIDLPDLATEVLGFLEKEAMHRSIEVQTSFSPGVPSILSNRGRLEEVLLNILHNAFSAVEDGGEILLSVESEAPDRVAVVVEDNGSGIRDEDLGHIFEPFFSTKGNFGTGLGLCISYDLVQKLGGRIDVWSKLGEGTRFTVTLPVDRETPLE